MTAQLHSPSQPSALPFQQLLEIVAKLGATERKTLLIHLLERLPKEDGAPQAHFASQRALAKDWLTETEDDAWQRSRHHHPTLTHLG